MKKLLECSKRPPIYTPGTKLMWTDNHISKQLLQIHLSQHTDLASRKQETISSTIDWIENKVSESNLSILDLGCGPGLYTEKLFQNGHKVTGMDFSVHSIEYAKSSASENGFDISYLHQNYLTLSDENKYDLIMMIFTDFGVLLPNERKELLKRVYKALKPGGVFLFDVLNKNALPNINTPKSWEVSESGGFWRDSGYLALSQSFSYEVENTCLNQHIIWEESGKVDIYNFWMHLFSHSELVDTLTAHNFVDIKCYEGVLTDSDMYSSDSVTFCTATK